MSEDVLNVMAKHKNIYKHIHLPVQSGSDKILSLMNRNIQLMSTKSSLTKLGESFLIVEFLMIL